MIEKILSRFALAAFILFLPGCAVYNTTSDMGFRDLMLKGYDPVSYFSKSSPPQKGEKKFSYHHKYGTYLFSSNESLEKFKNSPDSFTPQYGGFCSKGVSYAIRAGGDPEHFEIRDGRLFIFVNQYAKEYWSTDPEDFIEKADDYWKEELKDSPVKWTNLKRFIFRVPHYKTYPEEFADFERRTGRKPPL